MSEENVLEVWFDNGQMGTCHMYPTTTLFSFDRGWVILVEKDGATIAHYNINAINCIRRAPK